MLDYYLQWHTAIWKLSNMGPVLHQTPSSDCFLTCIRVDWNRHWGSLIIVVKTLTLPFCVFSYLRDPTLHWVCRWRCPRRSSGGPAASHCGSRSQTSGHTSVHRMGTTAHRCSRCSSGCLDKSVSSMTPTLHLTIITFLKEFKLKCSGRTKVKLKTVLFHLAGCTDRLP